jgi:hypothetical protein
MAIQPPIDGTMKIRPLLIFFLCLASVFSACLPVKPAPGPPVPTVLAQPSLPPQQTFTATPTDDTASTPLPAPSSTSIPPTDQPSLPEAQYRISAQFDFSSHHLDVAESITYTNSTHEALADLTFLVEPNLTPGVFALKSFKWSGGQPVEGYRLQGHQLRLPLPQPLPAGQSLSVSASYTLDLPQIPAPADDIRPIVFGYTDRQVNLVDWYLFLPAYRPGAGWLIHDPWFYGDHLVYDVADYQVDLQISKPPPGLQIAASAPARLEGQSYHYQLKSARSFAFSASLEYQVFTQTVGNITVLSYSFPFNPEAGQRALKDTADALKLYTQLFGPYPHTTLSVVEADFLDGMEYDGLFFLSRGFYNLYDGTPKGYLTAIAVHETAHQWWYGLVGNDQALEPWLDEALATYTERIFYEKTYPELVDWWWYFRVSYYQPAGWVNGAIYDFNGFRPYVNAVYLRGAYFMEDLRKKVGDEAFFAFLKDYAAQEKDRQSTANDFFTILKAHTSVDISSVIKAYFKPTN